MGFQLIVEANVQLRRNLHQFIVCCGCLLYCLLFLLKFVGKLRIADNLNGCTLHGAQVRATDKWKMSEIQAILARGKRAR